MKDGEETRPVLLWPGSGTHTSLSVSIRISCDVECRFPLPTSVFPWARSLPLYTHVLFTTGRETVFSNSWEHLKAEDSNEDCISSP